MPRRRNEQRQHRNVEQLDAIAEGQQQRTVLEYISINAEL
jgi:hypothetical protein